jgi:membrane protein DedA with SNARE-associated domain
MQQVLDWLASLPAALLYVVLAIFSALENIFPPVPADTVVAFGSFLAARGRGSLAGAFTATLIGNLAGAALMYALGRRFGADRIERRLGGGAGESASLRLRSLYGRFGLAALFVSRFLPAVRALVPPFAGALRIPPVRAMVVMGSASAIWYGLIAVLAYRAGTNWERLQALIGRSGRVVGVVAVAITVVALLALWLRRRRPTP